MTQRDRRKRRVVVGKLLAQATSVAGTPEADRFTDRALALTAKLGVEQADDPIAQGSVADTFTVEGEFLQQRIALLTQIASTLHCAYISWIFTDTTSTVEVFGAHRNVDRVRVLFDPLLARMLRQATNSVWSQSTGVSLQDHQIGWMRGFTLSIRARLRSAESAAAAEADCGSGAHAQQNAFDAPRAAEREAAAARGAAARS